MNLLLLLTLYRVKLIDVIPQSLFETAQKGIGSRRDIPVPIPIKVSMGSEPYRYKKITLKVADTSITYLTDSFGTFVILLYPYLASKKAVLISDDEVRYKWIYPYTWNLKSKNLKEIPPLKIVNLAGYRYINVGKFKIFYGELDSAYLFNLRDELLKVYKRASLYIGDFKTSNVLVDTHENTVIYHPNGITAFSVALGNFDDYSDWIHESVENYINGTIRKKIMDKIKCGCLCMISFLISRSKYNIWRWIGDGLAEYASIKAVPEICEEKVSNRLKDILNDTLQGFNPWKWGEGTGEISGYAYSLAIFLKMERIVGSHGIKRFLKEYLEGEDFSRKRVEKILKSVGFENVYISRDEALKYLKGACIR